MILHGDCLVKLKELADNSVDSVVSDPPAGISFMNKKWDDDKGGRDQWIAWLQAIMLETKRVLKPGGHALVWAIPRTSHWTATAVENAGFEVRDVVTHHFGSGFPKSQNIAIAIDKQSGAMGARGKAFVTAGQDGREDLIGTRGVAIGGHEPITDEAKQWQGWGTSLKPASEHWILARKPISESTVAKNVLRWGVGGLNIDASRIGTDDKLSFGSREIGDGVKYSPMPKDKQTPGIQHTQGRWPANLLLDETAAELLDEQSGLVRIADPMKKLSNFNFDVAGKNTGQKFSKYTCTYGGASRFFYVAKASKSERNAGLEGMPEVEKRTMNDYGDQSLHECSDGVKRTQGTGVSKSANHHPTVKPLKLMEYLIRLITPPGGTVLDPFAGSGSTLVAAKRLGFQFIGIEMSAEYVEIIEKRIAHAKQTPA